MEKRLLLFLQSEDLNPTKFADRIGVQRSSISHILSGRNKPSFDFLLKILNSFPQLNAEWLLTGKGKMYKSDFPLQAKLFDEERGNEEMHSYQKTVETTDSTDINEIHTPVAESDFYTDNLNIPEEVYKSKQSVGSPEIEKIVIFFSNKTFKDYIPG